MDKGVGGGLCELGPGRWKGNWKWLGKAGCLGLKAGKGIPGHEANCLLYRVNRGPEGPQEFPLGKVPKGR